MRASRNRRYPPASKKLRGTLCNYKNLLTTDVYVTTKTFVDITYDPAKRQLTLENRGLDFKDAPLVFAGTVVEFFDDRFDYGEERMITVGLLRGAVVVIVWTDRETGPHIISMRKATKGETNDYWRRVG